jgi:hypothetical protein
MAEDVLQAWLATVEATTVRQHQRDAWNSPASFLATGFAVALLTTVTAVLVQPRRF